MDKLAHPDSPYWLFIIRHYFRHNYVQNGLTLPYLIGARSIVEPHLPILGIQAFLAQAVECSSGITIMRCSDIGEYVLAELDNESRRYSRHYQRIGHLYVTDYTLVDVSSLQQLQDCFMSLYAVYIQKQCYSKVDGQWHYFSQKDVLQLQEVANYINKL